MSQNDRPFTNAVYLSATEDNEDKLKDAMLETVGAALATPGNHGFSILQSSKTPTNFLILEHWGSADALEADANSEALTEAMTKVHSERLVASGPSGSRWTRII